MFTHFSYKSFKLSRNSLDISSSEDSFTLLSQPTKNNNNIKKIGFNNLVEVFFEKYNPNIEEPYYDRLPIFCQVTPKLKIFEKTTLKKDGFCQTIACLAVEFGIGMF